MSKNTKLISSNITESEYIRPNLRSNPSSPPASVEYGIALYDNTTGSYNIYNTENNYRITPTTDCNSIPLGSSKHYSDSDLESYYYYDGMKWQNTYYNKSESEYEQNKLYCSAGELHTNHNPGNCNSLQWKNWPHNPLPNNLNYKTLYCTNSNDSKAENYAKPKYYYNTAKKECMKGTALLNYPCAGYDSESQCKDTLQPFNNNSKFSFPHPNNCNNDTCLHYIKTFYSPSNNQNGLFNNINGWKLSMDNLIPVFPNKPGMFAFCDTSKIGEQSYLKFVHAPINMIGCDEGSLFSLDNDYKGGKKKDWVYNTAANNNNPLYLFAEPNNGALAFSDNKSKSGGNLNAIYFCPLFYNYDSNIIIGFYLYIMLNNNAHLIYYNYDDDNKNSHLDCDSNSNKEVTDYHNLINFEYKLFLPKIASNYVFALKEVKDKCKTVVELCTLGPIFYNLDINWFKKYLVTTQDDKEITYYPIYKNDLDHTDKDYWNSYAKRLLLASNWGCYTYNETKEKEPKFCDANMYHTYYQTLLDEHNYTSLQSNLNTINYGGDNTGARVSKLFVPFSSGGPFNKNNHDTKYVYLDERDKGIRDITPFILKKIT